MVAVSGKGADMPAVSDHGAPQGIRQGKKRGQNLNHLLSFTLPPREAPPSGPRRTRRADGSKPFSRERYVHCQYRFVMRSTYDGSAQLADASVPLPWPDVAQVIVHAGADVCEAGASSAAPRLGLPNGGEKMVCPICLSPPTAARMTRCGHVYCYPCILRFLMMKEGKGNRNGVPQHQSKRCPICGDEMHPKDLKGVHWIDTRAAAAQYTPTHQPSVGAAETCSILTMRLVERPHESMLALPRSRYWPLSTHAIKALFARKNGVYCFQPDVLTYARVSLATPHFLLASLDRDIAQIDEEMSAEQQFQPDALSTASMQLARRQLIDAKEVTSAALDERNGTLDAAIKEVDMLSHVSPSPVEPLQSYYYYQAASGLNIFLHPLDIKVLLSQYKHYAHFPDTLQVVVQNAEEGTMDKNMERRCKYLSHLPMSSDVTFVEVDWPRTDALFAETQGHVDWKQWDDMLQERKQRRYDKATKEERARIKAEKGARSSMPFVPSRKYCGTTDFSDAYVPGMSFRESAVVGAEMYFPTHPGADAEPADDSPFPIMPTAPKQGKMQPVQKTVWGTMAAAGAEETLEDAHEMDEAWTALEQAQPERGAPVPLRKTNQNRKRGKPKLVLTGGGRGMG
ncbi:Delta(24(24(1)))-sterol reductase [Malassezia vespertilionis]|uniref:RING-type domain-containing protein n=1 Tax=Malassezia vespertilionis TaxID=2020962 RepID=A0A2N1J743_9BASI|nr:Delta(24(24(1)))-sterol reductase [Malassezia vespertilionis]PKI82364.1 hypothetical protein MVES_003717 [Malassezia vespertilionis]WFD08109.1 Delta(24(24(1)))-sterol reductase [Malassezia vespertilionis]